MKKICWSFFLLWSISATAQHTQVILSGDSVSIIWNGKVRLHGGTGVINNTDRSSITFVNEKEVALFNVVTHGHKIQDTAFSGLFFPPIPQFRRSVALWRYKPWNSWTKPIALHAAADMPVDDVQFFYWQYEDGTYAAVLPLNGNGFRTTLGSDGRRWGSKAVAYADTKNIDTIPAMAIAFGNDPFEIFKRIYEVSLKAMGKGNNVRVQKKFPEPFNYIGWCTWNASANGERLNEQLLLDAAKSFSDHHFPLGWMLIDDGWFQHTDKRLQTYQPNARQFPNGFRPLIQQLRKKYGIQYMGIWHTINGLWNGIDTGGALGKRFAPALFSWTQKINPDRDSTGTYFFVKPGSDALNKFYDDWYHYLKQEGFDFVKVDNQVVIERMSRSNYPIFSLSDSVHSALYRAVNKYFNGAVLNCMDMTAEAYFNFGTTAVARSEEDYFPYEKGETYDLQHGNAAAHVLQAIYNSIYFGQMVYPDFDIFQSHNPNAIYHAIARAINCGPIYITDNVGQQDFSVLKPLVYSDGKIIRSETPLLPTADCLFQVQDARLFKAFSTVGSAGLLGVWNAADANEVKGVVRKSDVANLKSGDVVMYEHFSKKWMRAGMKDSINVTLGRMGYQLYYVVPVQHGIAPLGLINKYNAPATITSQKFYEHRVTITLAEGGLLKAYCERRPSKVRVNGKSLSGFHFTDHILSINLPMTKTPVVDIEWK